MIYVHPVTGEIVTVPAGSAVPVNLPTLDDASGANAAPPVDQSARLYDLSSLLGLIALLRDFFK